MYSARPIGTSHGRQLTLPRVAVSRLGDQGHYRVEKTQEEGVPMRRPAALATRRAHAEHRRPAPIGRGCSVAYTGVINDELDLERRGIVRDGPNEAGDYLVEWDVLGDIDARWECATSLEVIVGLEAPAVVP